MLSERDKLIALLNEANQIGDIIRVEDTADYLLRHGMFVPADKDSLMLMYDKVYMECKRTNCFLCDYQNQHQHCMASKFFDRLLNKNIECDGGIR